MKVIAGVYVNFTASYLKHNSIDYTIMINKPTINIDDLTIKDGKVYSKAGNRVFGLMFCYCPKCKKFVKLPKMTKKKGIKWLYCTKCGSSLDIPHIEFDKEFKDKAFDFHYSKVIKHA